MSIVRRRVAWLWAGVALFTLVTCFAWPKVTGYDAHAYWAAWHRPDMYGGSPNTRDAFLYSPLFAQLVWPLAQLPWPAFLAVWTLAGGALYGWLLWPLPWRLRAPLLAVEIGGGNISLLIAAAIVGWAVIYVHEVLAKPMASVTTVLREH